MISLESKSGQDKTFRYSVNTRFDVWRYVVAYWYPLQINQRGDPFDDFEEYDEHVIQDYDASDGVDR